MMEYPLLSHWGHMFEQLQMFRKQKHLVDVILVLREKEYPAHSAVLAAYSPTLFVMLINPTTKNYKNQTVLNLDSFNISQKSLQKILDFMYDGNIACLFEDVSVEDVKKDAYFLGISQIVQHIDQLEHSDLVEREIEPVLLSSQACRSKEGDKKNREAKSLGKVIPHHQESLGKSQPKNARKRNCSDITETYPTEGTSAKQLKLCGSKYGSVSNRSHSAVESKHKIIKSKVVEETITEINESVTDDTGKTVHDTSENITLDSKACSKETQCSDSTEPLKDIVETAMFVAMGDIIKTSAPSENTIRYVGDTTEDETVNKDSVEDTPEPATNNTPNNSWLGSNSGHSSTKDAANNPDESTKDKFTTKTAIKEEVEEVKEEVEELLEEYDESRDQKLSQWDEFCVHGDYICPHCPHQKWKYLDKLCYHMIRVHGQKAFQCAECGQECATKKSFVAHLNKHSGVKPYHCIQQGCGKRFSTSRLLNSHKKVHSKKAPQNVRPLYECPEEDCSDVFSTRQQQDSHLLSYHPQSKTFCCHHENCAMKCTTHTQLIKHVYTHTPAEDKMLMCEDCGKSVSRKNLAEHKLSHSTTQHQCQFCTYATPHMRYMDSHMKRRHGKQKDGKEALKMFKCPQCSFASFFAAELRTHKKKHEAESTITCGACSYKTSNSSLMKAHKRTHTNERPYICQICTKGFRQSTHLNRHSRVHTGDRPFVCTLCGRGFIDKRALINHQYNDHANVNQFLCHLCPFECVKQDSLRTHMQKTHGIETFIMDEKKNRREITITGSDIVIHDKPQCFDDNRMDPLIGDLKQTKEVVSDFTNLIPTTIEDQESLGSLLETPLPTDQSEASLEQVMDEISQSEHPLQEVMGDIDQSEDTLAITIPNFDQSQSALQDCVDQTEADSEERILAEDDVKLISKALQTGNVVLHFV